MTATQQFKILEILEPVMGRERATELTKSIEEVIDAKVEEKADVLATKEDVYKASAATKEDIHKSYERLEGRMWATFITLVVMILGLYATIIFKH